MKETIFKQIKDITLLLSRKSLQISQNFPKYEGVSKESIVWEQYQNLAFQYKNEPYEEIFNRTNDAKDYNFKLFDAAIVQMRYEFYKNKLIKHTLSYLPNPNIEGFKDEPDDYEDRFFSSTKLFADMVDKKIVVSPIRFDYSEVFTDCEHPYAHATFGNYEACRIPISAPISPNRFVLFILRSFYFDKFTEVFEKDFKDNYASKIDLIDKDKNKQEVDKQKSKLKLKNEYLNSLFTCNIKFDRTVSDNEKKIIHFNFE